MGVEVSGLGSQRLDGVLRLLEDCERVRGLDDFRATALEGLARHLNLRSATFFLGATPRLCFEDPSPVVTGRAVRMVDAYVERFRVHDPFAQPRSVTALARRRVLTLSDVDLRGAAGSGAYRDSFFARHGVAAKMVTLLPCGSTTTAVLGVLSDEVRAFREPERALFSLVGRHLGNMLGWHLGDQAGCSALRDRLSLRQAEVVDLVAAGLTNDQIATELSVGVETVKKHITAAMRSANCRNRTQLAIAWGQGR